MVSSPDIPGPDKHLRFGHYTEELATVLQTFPGVTAIVLHTHGTNGEHPHLHAWWTGKSVTNQTIRNRLKAFNPIFQSMKSQNDWSFRNHESFPNWSNYVQKNKTHRVLYGVLPPPPLDVIEMVIPTPATPSIPAPVRVRKLTSEEKLMNYCIREEGFKYNQWGIEHWEILEYRKQAHDKVAGALVAYANGRLDNRQLTYMGRNIIYTFANEELREYLTREWSIEARKFW